MPGLVPGIHVLGRGGKKDVDGRVKPGHDERECMGGRLRFYPRDLRSVASTMSAARVLGDWSPVDMIASSPAKASI